MQHSRFTEQQIAFVLEQVARGASIEQTCHAAGIPVPTYYQWKAKYAGMKPADIRRLNEIEEENKRLKRLLATLLVEKPAPSETRVQLPVPVPVVALPAPAAAALTANRHWSALAQYLPAAPALDVRSRMRTLARRSRVLLRARAPAQMALRRSSSAWLVKTWRTRRVLLLCFAGGLIGGFAIGLGPDATSTAKQDGPQPVPVNMDLRVNSYGGLASSLDKGWGAQQPWGRWMEGGSATVLLGFDGPARGDVELLLEARARLAEGQPDETVIVSFNGEELGRWRLPKREGEMRRRFIVPGSVFNRDTAAKLELALEGRAPLTPIFGLEAVSLRDARFLHDYRGFVDSCTGGEVSGWAVAEGVPVTVAATVGGKPLQYRQISRERADLAEHGLPADAGFHLQLSEPAAPGTSIEVRFANGRPLIGSPCKP